MKLRYKNALAFDDILLVPKYSSIKSRLDTSLSTRLSRRVFLDSPILSTNMATVTEGDMLLEMDKLGSLGFMHRFLPVDEQIDQIKRAKDLGLKKFGVSIGVKQEDYHSIKKIVDEVSPTVILLDIAHGDSVSAFDMLKYIKLCTDIDVIAGNITTQEAYSRFVEAGADGVRVGVGPGQVCSTRVVTGFGYPLLQALLDISEVSIPSVPVIADGGIKKSADIVKALAAGANTVCIGSLIAGTTASPGKVEVINGKSVKEHYGMSSAHAMDKFKGGKRSEIAAEGLFDYVPFKGATSDIIEELLGGIRSGLTYNGSTNITHLQETAEYVILSPGSIKESKH